MNNEPVAWRCKKFYETQEGWFYNENQIGEPLYTHPAKTLTEIIEKNKPEIEKANAYIKLLEDEIKALKAKTEDEALKTFYEDRLEAGKRREETLLKTIEALLRKAQEK